MQAKRVSTGSTRKSSKMCLRILYEAVAIFRYNRCMKKTELVDELIIRLEQLQEIMQIKEENVSIDNVLLQAIVNHANETTLNAVIADVERMIVIKDDEISADTIDDLI